MNHNFGEGLRRELRLVQLLEAATGLDAVPTASYVEIEMSVHVMVDEAIGICGSAKTSTLVSVTVRHQQAERGHEQRGNGILARVKERRHGTRERSGHHRCRT